MSKTFHLKVTTPDGILFEDDIEKISLQTTEGQITLLPNHIPLVTALGAGEIVITAKEKTTPLVIYGGFAEVRSLNQVVILADAGEHVEKINLEQAEKARERAQTILREKFNTADYEDAAMALERELARIRIAKKYRRPQHHKESRPSSE